MVDQERAQQIAEQYSRQAEDFDRRHDEYLRAHPDPSDPGSEVDWQKEVETEQNMRVVAEMQVQLQREIRLEREKCVTLSESEPVFLLASHFRVCT